MASWKCDVCGYVHEGVSPPETCPVCGVGPDLFSPLEIDEHPSPAQKQAWRCEICDHIERGAEPPESCPLCGAPRSAFREAPEVEPAGGDVEKVEKLVIIGAGVAGVTAAERAIRTSADVEITLIAKERPYYRLNLTRLLAGEVKESELAIRPEWGSKVELVEGEASSIDREGRRVHLADGRFFSYDRVILANGAHAFVPPLPGATRGGVWTLRTIDDARSIIQAASAGARAICIGGGLLGLESAGALSRRGASVTVLEGFSYLLPRQLNETSARLLRQHLEGLGLTVRCGVVVKEIFGDERVAGVRLEDGDELPADLVVIATGVRPNSYLARQSGLTVNRGVVVDDAMRTSDPAIFAAGDVAEHRGIVYGIWPASYAQGATAGITAAGGASSFSGLAPSARIKVLDVDLYSVGQIRAEDASYRVFEEERDRSCYRLVCQDGRLVGAVLYGDTELSSLVSAAVEGGTHLAELGELLEAFPAFKEQCAIE